LRQKKRTVAFRKTRATVRERMRVQNKTHPIPSGTVND